MTRGARVTKTWWNKEIKWYQAILLHSRIIPGRDTAVFITGFMCHFILMTQKYIPERLKNKSYGPRKLSLTSPHSQIHNMMETSGFLELLPESWNMQWHQVMRGLRWGLAIYWGSTGFRGATIWLYCYGVGCVINNKWYPKWLNCVRIWAGYELLRVRSLRCFRASQYCLDLIISLVDQQNKSLIVLKSSSVPF